jgi:protein O-GlcNAc transferase
LALSPGYVQALSGRGSALAKLHRPQEALASFDRALQLKPDDSETLVNRGHILIELRRHEQALASFDRGLQVKPNYVEALVQRGKVLANLRRHEQALVSYDRALAIKPNDAEALHSRGAALHQLKRNDEALASFEQALAVDPRHPHAFGGALGSATITCDWTREAKLAQELEARIVERRSLINPFMLLGRCDDPSLQLRCAKRFIETEIPVRPAPLWTGTVLRRDRIRIAYLSADFRQHATAHLMAELFELHERTRFEVLGVSFGPDDGSAMRARLVSAFDQFHDVRSRSDREVAGLLNDLQVDIAVDLKGFTTDCRPGILAHRPAPIQVNYLGYHGTMGADFIDYVIGDEIVLPFELQPFFAEQIVHLPDCYQVNDSKRTIATHTPARKNVGLRDDAFVFCCFNNNHKIAAPVFDVWMRILRKIEGSELWLLRDNPSAERNLRKEAAARGVDPARLVFAGRLNLDEHLARHRLADLFLDTLPFNAHTTASDALWAGLPLVERLCPAGSPRACCMPSACLSWSRTASWITRRWP